eukprot:Colp12_sorted_trinity150504_noHs@6640
MVDTCQAATLFTRLYSPNIIAIGSSMKGENSYSHHHDNELGVSVIDRFTHDTLDVLERLTPHSTLTLHKLFSTYSYVSLSSHHQVRSDLFPLPLEKVLVTDYFGQVQTVELPQSPRSTVSSESSALNSGSFPATVTAHTTPVSTRNETVAGDEIVTVSKRDVEVEKDEEEGVGVLKVDAEAGVALGALGVLLLCACALRAF